MARQGTVNGLAGSKPHFVLVPLFAQGHMIPMLDLALLLAHRGVLVSFITTPFNASRIRSAITRAQESGLPVEFVEFPFPYQEVGLPQGGENIDVVPPETMLDFFKGMSLLQKPLELYLRQHQTHPSCMIADPCQPWARRVAENLQIPRLSFFSICCFTLLCTENIYRYKVYDAITDLHEQFDVPGLQEKIVVTKDQAPEWFDAPGWEEFNGEFHDAQLVVDGIVVNTFDDLEPSYIESYQKAMGKKVWAVGPFFLHHQDLGDVAARGDKASIDTNRCLGWLDMKKPKSVVYVSFGSLTYVSVSQLKEIGAGLEASEHSFVWVIKNRERSPEVEDWLEGFEERIGERGLVIKGWSPQLMILSHPATGGFMTHCGWNSSLESVSSGVPMITWPYFADQFLNERMAVDVLKIGVSVGVTEQGLWTDDGSQKLWATSDDVERAVRNLMDDGAEAEARKKRAYELGEKAREAMKEGGSSYANMTDLIQYFSNHTVKTVEENRN